MSENPVLDLVPVRIDNQDLTKHIREVKSKKEVLKYLEKETIVQKLKNIDQSSTNGTRDHMFITFLWMTGVRVTEAISLKKRDINNITNELKILWQKRKAYTYRTLAIPPALTNMLGVYTSTLKSDEKVFPFTRQNADLIVKRHFGDAVSSHMLRHSYAINYLRQSNNSTDLLVLQRLLGHQNIHTTMKYLQIVPNDMHEALKGVSFY